MTVTENIPSESIEEYNFGKKKKQNKMKSILKDNKKIMQPAPTEYHVGFVAPQSAHSPLLSESLTNSTEQSSNEITTSNSTETVDGDNVGTGDDFSKLKKKKKKNFQILLKNDDDDSGIVPDENNCNCNNETVNEEKIETTSKTEVGAVNADEEDFTKLKKKRKNKAAAAVAENLASTEPEWQEYTYDELLDRLFKTLREKNPEVFGPKKFVMKPPTLARVGTKRTSIKNYGEICKLLNRDIKHLFDFFEAELGIAGSSINENTELILKGRFCQGNIEKVLRKYIKEYVQCRSCQSSETNLVKENRILYLKCSSCTSSCSVSSVKSGFQAQVGRRAAQRC